MSIWQLMTGLVLLQVPIWVVCASAARFDALLLRQTPRWYTVPLYALGLNLILLMGFLLAPEQVVLSTSPFWRLFLTHTVN
jgi:hypothetical protein